MELKAMQKSLETLLVGAALWVLLLAGTWWLFLGICAWACKTSLNQKGK